MELYAVFSSPVLYKVQTQAGRSIGSLEQAFVDKLVPEMSSFLLGGRAWTVSHINYTERTVQVTAAPRGKKPSWGGFAPQLLGFELCQQIAELLKSDEQVPYIDEIAQSALQEYCADLGTLLKKQKLAIEIEPDRSVWWTFAGGQINTTLRYGLQCQHDWKITADNFKLKIEGDSLGVAALFSAIEQMRDRKFWHSPTTQEFILTHLPEYRLSKFQRALPDVYSLEIISNYLIDVPNTTAFLASCS
jgi:ATP-dependent helicase Lhr and Lhr-like helicase